MRSRIFAVACCLVTLAVFLKTPAANSAEPQIITNSIKMKLARIPEGSFMMGSPRSEAERDDKEERHEVAITKPFYIGVYEVKQSEYIEVMQGLPKASNRSAFKSNDNLQLFAL